MVRAGGAGSETAQAGRDPSSQGLAGISEEFPFYCDRNGGQ